jgi:hypothetical protein
MGTRAVVAAGWAVDDLEARIFAETFHRSLLGGESFGTAVKQARRQIYGNQGRGTTWGAYQCYGEPDWRLDGPAAAAPPRTPGPFAAAAEVMQALDAIRGSARTGAERDIEALRARLREVAARAAGAPKSRTVDYTGNAEVAAALGDVFAELGELDAALDWYDRAVTAEIGSPPVRAIEQRADLRARLALRRGAGAAGAARTEVTRSLRDLRRLMTLAGPTAERHALVGGCHKRLAQLSAGDPRSKALHDMAKAYAAAEQQASGLPSGHLSPQHRLMQAAALVVLALPAGDRAGLDKVRALVAPVAEEAEQRYAESAEFWDGIAIADAAVLRGIAAGAEGVERIRAAKEAYLRPWRRNGSSLMLASVIDQLEFLAQMLRDAKGVPAATAQALEALRSELAEAMAMARGIGG